MHYASYNGHTALVKYLIKKGANVSVVVVLEVIVAMVMIVVSEFN